MNSCFNKRKNRKRAVLSIISTLELIRDLELRFHESIPDSPQNEDIQFESACAVDVLDDAVDLLRGVF